MKPISRRTCLQRLAFAVPALSLGHAFADAPKPTGAESTAIAEIARKFMEKFEVPGLSVAFSHHGTPVYQAAFGMADESAGEKLTPDHLFRIASISKPITAVAIFALVEQGKLKLGDKVLGPDGLLSIERGKKLSPGVADITVHHLLTHTCGGWQNDGDDPMFQHAEMNHHDLIVRTLRDQPLKNDPGKKYAYSNFGYCLLGRVIEKVTGKSYTDHVQENLLVPCGIDDMKIAGNTRADRISREVIYYGRNGEDPYHMNVRRMDAHGGWLASPQALVKFLLRTDGFGDKPDLLKHATIKTMFEGTPANAGYASGWSINETPNRWHGGSLPGTSTIAVQTASGLCWAGFTNARNKDIHGALDQMMWHMAKAVPSWAA